MKKFILAACFMIAATTIVSAQQGQGGGNMQERMAQMKQSLKDSVGLTDAQAQIVLDLQAEMRPQMMELRNVAEADRPTKMKEINDAMQTKLAKALNDENLAKKVTEYNSRRRGGGRGMRPQGQQ